MGTHRPTPTSTIHRVSLWAVWAPVYIGLLAGGAVATILLKVIFA